MLLLNKVLVKKKNFYSKLTKVVGKPVSYISLQATLKIVL